MNEKLIKLESIYWKISKIIGVLFMIINYHMWTDPFNIIKVILVIAVATILTFVVINVIDLLVGYVSGIVKYISRDIKNRRLLKGFYSTHNIEGNE